MTKDEQKILFRLLSIYLDYHDLNWPDKDNLEQIAQSLPEQQQAELLEFAKHLGSATDDELAEEYVKTFDFSLTSSLHLTALTEGDERLRGQMLANMKILYLQEGYDAGSYELPDYLPLVFEFISIASDEAINKLMPYIESPLFKLQCILEQMKSPYAAIVRIGLKTLQDCVLPQAANREGGSLCKI